MSKSGKKDSRIINWKLHRGRAIKYQKIANNYRNNDGGFIGGAKNIIANLFEYLSDSNLGKGLHPLQDIRAHSKDLVGENSALGGVIKWKYHDPFGPKVKYDRAFADDKTSRPKEYNATESDTLKYLNFSKTKSK
jgi:hypothetical protein